MRGLIWLAVTLLIVVSSTPSLAYSTWKTSTSVFDLQQELPPLITLNSGVIYVSGTGVRLSNAATNGVASFVGTDAPFPTNNVVCSWNVDMPSGTGIRTEVRAVNGGTATAWYEIARIGTIPGGITRVKSDSNGYIDQDTLMLNTTWPRIEYRVTLYTNSVGTTPTLRLMSVCYADSTTLIPYEVLPAPGNTTSLAVPWWSQYDSTLDPNSICGPTSMSMAMAYNGYKLTMETVASEAYDSYNHIYGNWPFIAQEAARHGFKSYYSRANSQQPIRDFLAQGVPVEIGMAYGDKELTNSPIPSTAGHLVLCVGVTAGGDWICNDPAGSDSRWDHVVYFDSQIANVWGTHNATVIPCIPNSVYWRFPYFPYKSTDPVLINKNGLIELFARGVDGQIYHTIQTSPNGGWSAWSSMGGTAASDPVAVTNRTGGNSVFARFDDGNLYYASQNGSGGAWSDWTLIGGPIVGKPSVGKSPDGRLDVFCRMPDGTIWHRWESTYGGWQTWVSLGGSAAGDPVVGLNWEGREEVFVRWIDNQLYHKWQMNDGSWSGWASLGGTITGEPAIGKTSDGRIEVSCRFTDGTMRHNWQNGQIVGTSWSGWTSYSGSTDCNVAIGRTPGFIQSLFFRDSGGQINHVYQTAVDGGWSGWASLGGAAITPPIVGHNEDGRLRIFTVRSDGKMWSMWQTAGGGWSSWSAFGSAMFPENIAPVISYVTSSPAYAAKGDDVSISATVTDNVSVAGVTANGVNLSYSGSNTWSGTIHAIDNLGYNNITIEARDASGNIATDSSKGYTTARVVALNNRAVWDPAIGTAVTNPNLFFAVYGKVTVQSSSVFTVDDGSGKPVKVYASYHGLSNGQWVRARGTLVRSGTDTHLNSSAAFITPLD